MKLEIIIFWLWLHGWGQLRVCCGCGMVKNLKMTSTLPLNILQWDPQEHFNIQQPYSGHLGYYHDHKHQPRTHLAIGHPWELFPSFPV